MWPGSGAWRLGAPQPRALASGGPPFPADSLAPQTRSAWAPLTTGGMVLCGPCANPACKNPEKASGQWQYIPDEFDEQVRDGATCTCKKARCLRYFGLKGEPQKPGRKRGRDADSTAPAPTGDEPTMPAKYKVAEVKDIHGLRCAPPRPARPCHLQIARDRLPRACRYANIAKMSAEQRANKLPKFVSEYLVRGKFFRSAKDEEGVVTSYWVQYVTLLRDVEDADDEIETFEINLPACREEEREEWEGEESETE